MSTRKSIEATRLSAVSTRRGLLKMAGAAAAGAAGVAALRTVPAAAGGSGNTIAMMTPLRIVDTRNGHGPLAGGNDYVFGPFPVGSTTFDSSSYSGMMANLTATAWNAAGYLSIRANGSPVPVVSNVNFSGSLIAVPNFVITQFGPPTVVGMASDGKVIIHVEGPTAVHVIVDLFAYLGPDQ